jgi:hypothetical protein
MAYQLRATNRHAARRQRVIAPQVQGKGSYLLLAFFQLLEDFVHVETRGLLPLRIVFEGCEELSDVVLCRYQHEGVIKQPIIIRIRRHVGAVAPARRQPGPRVAGRALADRQLA